MFPLLDSLRKYYDTKYVHSFFVMKVSKDPFCTEAVCAFRFTMSFLGSIRVARVGSRENIKRERVRSRSARAFFFVRNCVRPNVYSKGNGLKNQEKVYFAPRTDMSMQPTDT